MKKNNEMKFVLILALIAIIGLIFRAYGLWLTEKVRIETIEAAVLVESNDQGYILSFNGEEHEYTFD